MSTEPQTETALFGRGMLFPPGLDVDGRFAWSTGQRNIEESIRIILMTEPGERLMLPTFGVGLQAFLFEPNIPSTHRLIEERVTHGLRRWEPRIEVSSVVVAADPVRPDRATVAIAYSLVATGARQTIDLAVPVAQTGGG